LRYVLTTSEGADVPKRREREGWNQFADGGRAVLVAGATLLPNHAFAKRARVSAGATLLAIKLITKMLKETVPERRPDGEDSKSFPSEHAAECVAAAMILEREYSGKVGAFAYALAAGVSLSRIESKKHYPHDVAAGALIGCAAVWLSLQLRLLVERRILAA
jgi:membrane-associated phospholipid phosphatase